MSFAIRDNLDHSAALISREKADSVANSQLQILLVGSAIAVSVAGMVSNSLRPAVTLGWLGSIILLYCVRFLLARMYKDGVFEGREDLFLSCSIVGSLTSGVLWGLVYVFVIDVNSVHGSYVMLMLFGLCAGSTISNTIFPAGNMAFIMPIMVSELFKLSTSGATDGYLLAVGVVLYVAVLITATLRNEAHFTKGIQIRQEAAQVAASLARKHDELRESTFRLSQLSNRDQLTNLVNRTAFAQRLDCWLQDVKTSGGSFLLVLLDLDHFKSINDTLGHSIGDRVLRETANRLSLGVPGDNVVARLGGDEYAILLAGPGQSRRQKSIPDYDVRRMVEGVMAKVSGPYQVGEQRVNLGAAVGVVKYPEDGETAEDLLAHADLALYAAKESSRLRWRRFDTSLLAAAKMTRDIDNDFLDAIETGALQVWFQPQVALKDKRYIGLEALLRWKHPEHGWISPPLVVAACLRTRRSHILTGFVLDQVCRKIGALASIGLTDVVVAVNISPTEFKHYAVPDMVRNAIHLHEIDPKCLEVEITEDAFAADETALAALKALETLGVRLAIDDFGTGYSSIAYLRSMRVDRIKIDRSFITGFADRPGDRILVQAILGLGRSFGIEVLAEGVETLDEAILLQSLGCHAAQGYYFSRPLDAVRLGDWEAAHEAGPLAAAGASPSDERRAAVAVAA